LGWILLQCKHSIRCSSISKLQISGEDDIGDEEILPSPSYHDIRKTLLNETKHKIKAQIAERTKLFIRTYGATLVGDGWNSINKHPLLNMMCVSPASEEFLGAIDTSSYMKDVVYIADVIKRYVIEVGSQNIVQVCMDNASMMRKIVSIV
jgi:hypothetical protein